MVNLTDPVLTSFEPDEDPARYRATPVLIGETMELYKEFEAVPIAVSLGEQIDHLAVIFLPRGKPFMALVQEFDWDEEKSLLGLVAMIRQEFAHRFEAEVMSMILLHLDHQNTSPGHKVMDCYFVGQEDMVYVELHYTEDKEVERVQKMFNFDSAEIPEFDDLDMTATENAPAEIRDMVAELLRNLVGGAGSMVKRLKKYQAALSSPLPS